MVTEAKRFMGDNEGYGFDAALREHGAVLGRVCMALLGDREATERALERVARSAGETRWTERGRDALVRLLGLAQRACATQLSRAPITVGRETKAPDTARMGAAASAGAARTALARLKPTEREAIVLHVVGGLDANEVAAAIGIDRETARTRIARGIGSFMENEGR